MVTGRITVVAALGTTQTIAWASSYYMPATLGAPIAAALHLPGSLFFGVGIAAVGLSAGLCLAACGSLFLLHPRRAGTHPSPASS